MRKHFIIALILLFSVSLSACNKAEISTETSSILPTQETEVIEETSTQITTSEPSTTEKSTSQVVIPKEWEQIALLLPPENTRKPGRPSKDNRLMLNAMNDLACTQQCCVEGPSGTIWALDKCV